MGRYLSYRWGAACISRQKNTDSRANRMPRPMTCTRVRGVRLGTPSRENWVGGT